MAKTVLIDELHLTVRIPADLPEADADAIRKILMGTDLTSRLRRAIREVIRAFPELASLRVTLSR